MALFRTNYKNIRIICLNIETVSAVISYGDDGGVEGDNKGGGMLNSEMLGLLLMDDADGWL